MSAHDLLPSRPELSALASAQLAPPFLFGAATAAYQIEGAATEGGRGPSIWDRFSHEPGRTVNGDTGDVACDHYHRWRDDVALMSRLGLQAYRFSIAWSRVQPAGRGAWNDEGIAFYDRLVDALLERGIQPHATLYHWDLPQALQDAGGWARRDTAFHFADYAGKVGRVLGDRLASLCTHNEPWCTAVLGHEVGKFAPGLQAPALAAQVSHHLLLSHGLAVERLRADGVRAPLGIVLNQSPVSAASASAEDRAAAATEYARFVRWYMDPVFKGQYPEDPGIVHRPRVEPGDLATISAPIDLLGLNYYTRIWVSRSEPVQPRPDALGVTDMGWEIYPEGLRDQLLALHREYPNLPPVFITENGMAEADQLHEGQVDDPRRVAYLHAHLEAVAQARAAGVDVRGYFYWSLMDNYEWDSGYAKRFGIVHVDYTTQVRTPKASALWYRDTIARLQERQAGRG
ncbi:GH1 family beta-glucosidase [Aquabacterium sp.]|uniref:GH1 family beta-glucosidase n=1 Tax=Aquabacterium sp. TaxID=1872578 RepID=UPI0037837297